MEKVLGIGGLFFRANDPAKLANWYRDHLGIIPVPQDYESPCWKQEAGFTVFAPFEAKTDYFGPGNRQWMVNFRVQSLERMVAQLRKADIAVEIDATEYPNGRFARLYDPEGNPIELWEPKNIPATSASTSQ